MTNESLIKKLLTAFTAFFKDRHLGKNEKADVQEIVDRAVAVIKDDVRETRVTQTRIFCPDRTEPLNIHIRIHKRKHDPKEGDAGPYGKRDHCYIWYTDWFKPEKGKKQKEPTFLPGRNYVSTPVARGQKVTWYCYRPFTIYFGGTSIITTDREGWPRPRQIIPYLKAFYKPEGQWYETPPVYIVNNALSGCFKYNVSVYIKEFDIICVDDPENVVPPPRGG